MLSSFKLFKNKRGRFVSFELDENKNHYEAYFITKQGRHSFITYVLVDNEQEYIDKLELKEASEVEHIKAVLYRINSDLENKD